MVMCVSAFWCEISSSMSIHVISLAVRQRKGMLGDRTSADHECALLYIQFYSGVMAHAGYTDAMALARKEADLALQALECLPPSPERSSLEAMVDYVLVRMF